LRHLHNGHISQWSEELALEQSLLNKMALWMTEQFNEATGRFEETSDNVYDRNMEVMIL
jgi:hypothetical protein